jgi:hypothetical protein
MGAIPNKAPKIRPIKEVCRLFSKIKINNCKKFIPAVFIDNSSISFLIKSLKKIGKINPKTAKTANKDKIR